MNKKALVNYIYTTAYQILLVLLPIVTTPYISRVLGVENIGKESYAATILSYFVLFGQIGLNIYGRKEIACVQQDRNKRSLIFFQLSFIRICLFVIVCVSYYIFTTFNSGIDKVLFLINGISIWANLIDVTWYFQGLEEFKLITIRNFLIRIVCVICTFILVKSSSDLYIYVAINCVSNFVAQLLLWPSLRRWLIPVRFTVEGIKKHFINSWVMFIPTVFNTLYTKLDKIMLGVLTTEAEVGVYAQGEKITDMLFKLIGSMGIVFMPVLANMIASDKDEKVIGNTLRENGRLVWAIGIPLVAGLAGVARVFTAVFFGAGYEKTEFILCILAPIILALGFSDLYGGQYLIASGHQKEFNISIAVGAVINIAMNYFMIPCWHSIGAAIATLIAETSIVLVQAYITHKYIRFSIAPKLYYVVAGVLIFIITKSMDLLLEKNIYVLAGQVLIGGIIYIAVLYWNKDEFLLKGIRIIKEKLKKLFC